MKYNIYINTTKEWAKELGKEIEKFLANKGLEKSRKEDLSIIIGGDGTIFYYKDKINGVIFGIGGEKSKVCQAKRGDWKEKLMFFLETKKSEERITLDVKINNKDVGWVINDVVVHSRRHNFIEIYLKIGERSYEFGGDGIIVATPTGSTGYAFSAGGIEIKTNESVIEIVGICPYLRKFNGLIVNEKEEVKIKAKGDADLILDGQKIIELKENDIIKVSASKKIKFAVVK